MGVRKRRCGVTTPPGALAVEEAAPQGKRRHRERAGAPTAKAVESSLLAEAVDAASNLSGNAAELEGPPGEEGTESGRQGVVHFASLPAYMKPEKLRHMMEQFGEIGRVYL